MTHRRCVSCPQHPPESPGELVLRAAVGGLPPAALTRRLRPPPDRLAELPTLGLGHRQFEALITTARLSTNPNDFALVALLGLLGLRIFETCGSDITDLGYEHGHRVLRVRGKDGTVVLVPLPPAVARAIQRAVGERAHDR